MRHGKLSSLVAATLIAATVSTTTPQVSSPAAAIPATSRFVPVEPTRLVDTRSGTALQVDELRDFQITGTLVPASASGVVMNVTVDRTQGTGYLQVLPTGQATAGTTSTLNVDRAGSTIANATLAPLGDGGQVSIYTTFSTDVILDIFGYFVPATSSASGRLVPLTPTRILDTRDGTGVPPPVPDPDYQDCVANIDWTQWPAFWQGSTHVVLTLCGSGWLDDGWTISLQVAGNGGVPASGASAVLMSVTVTEPSMPGWVQVAPTPLVEGASSNLNFGSGATVANLVVVPLGTDGKVDLFTFIDGQYADRFGHRHLIADVVGYFTDATAPTGQSGLFVPMSPTRVLDTRLPHPQPELATGTIVDAAPPAAAVGASAIAGNLTSTGGDPGGYLQLAPKPLSPGATSNLNTFYADQTVACAVVSPLGTGGLAQVYTFGSTHVLLDVTGWFMV